MSEKSELKSEIDARVVLIESHPLHATFKGWVEKNCGDTKLTLRKARKFKRQNPRYFIPTKVG